MPPIYSTDALQCLFDIVSSSSFMSANPDRQAVNVLTATILVKIFLLLYVFPVCHGIGGDTFRHLFIMASNTPKDSISLSSPGLQHLRNHITIEGIADDRDLRKCVEEEWEHRLSPSKFKIESPCLVAPVWNRMVSHVLRRVWPGESDALGIQGFA
ncbi:hypothetical protein IW262DRAFT_1456105 [Armillaria fumosa]|nr:hypothetical protein IW262DRAFT_1469860 [Armillaria fumosa]KAK0228893.1 hypothetical protein IW262DRAFT_1456105 [Armillaria fumosa]